MRTNHIKIIFVILFSSLILTGCTSGGSSIGGTQTNLDAQTIIPRDKIQSLGDLPGANYPCKEGYTLSKISNTCITLDQSCVEQVGPSTHKTLKTGGAYCDCIDGYTWNPHLLRCIEDNSSPPTPIKSSPVCSCSSNIYNCDDFSTHREAQTCYNYCIDEEGYDVHRLDRDKDGSACETLP